MAALMLGLLLAANHPCVADADRLCKGVEPGGGRVARCLKQHQAELSPACKDKQKSFREQVERVQESCKGDVEKFCSGVTPGRGNVVRCLRGHAPDLSAGCRKDLEEARRRVDATRESIHKTRVACAVDEQRFCPDVSLGSGLERCLKEHASQLSLDCKRALAEPADTR